jgi:hypothetical protein
VEKVSQQNKKENKMTEEENKIMVRIGQEIAAMIGKNPDSVFCYIEAREMWMSGCVFQDEGDRAVYYRPSRGFGDAVEDLWYVREAEKRWGAMRYEIADGQFLAEFDFPDQFDPNEDENDRKARALKTRFGDKPLVYPKWDEGYELTEDDLSDL